MSHGTKFLTLTLCLVHEPPRVLLGMKKKGFGAGKWNGFGGKVEEGETMEEATRRELQEEAGIAVSVLKHAGIILCDFDGEPFLREVHVFRASGISDEPREMEEMRPQWFHESSLPHESMWESDALWLPFFLRKEPFHADLAFDAERRLIRHDVKAAS